MKCAYVNISLSATSVRVLGHVNVELVDMHPACCTSAFKNLFLRATVFGGYTYQLAKYDKTYKVFRLVTPVPSVYKGRIHAYNQRVQIIRMKFEDEGTRFYMEYYYDQSFNYVESTRVKLKNVYGR